MILTKEERTITAWYNSVALWSIELDSIDTIGLYGVDEIEIRCEGSSNSKIVLCRDVTYLQDLYDTRQEVIDLILGFKNEVLEEDFTVDSFLEPYDTGIPSSEYTTAAITNLDPTGLTAGIVEHVGLVISATGNWLILTVGIGLLLGSTVVSIIFKK